jgi:hypothetical protein
VQFGIESVGLGELILQDNDSARRVEASSAVNQFTGPRRDPELIARVAAVSALGALRREQFRLIEASQESRGGSEYLRGATHAVRGVIVIIELSVQITIGRTVLRLYNNTFRGAGKRRAYG